ncbi:MULTISPECIES: sensor histidine kinase [Paenibacillus]|uniref:histidine kinase n=1 Tax=Paenibacillus borealis TaxID=160799 RepID=A0ABX3H559_PAEBO|nr:HAMP domain-containing sensor histidine kinase [Paenibacillus borealis]OMD45568.1 two-component sensor histidine kinase [Paenibacillus borealis]
MRLWRTRNQRPLQTSLALDFLRFLVIVLVISLGAYLFIQLDVTQKLKDYQLADPDLKVTASQYLNNPKSGPETEKLLRSRGWLEILDGSKLIKEVIGNKQDQMISYSEEQLYKLLENDRSQDYYYSLSRYPGPGSTDWLLLKIPRDRIDISINSYPFMSYFNHSVTFYILIGAMVLLVLVVVYSYSVARRILKPLKTINEGLKEMIQGNYSTRISVHAEQEFEQMAETFNYMADMIEKTTKATRLAEESKQRMMMDLSHDLKTPVTSIQGYAQALYEGRVEDVERQRKYLSYIHNKSSQVTKLIQNMMELLKTDSPDFLLKMGHHELGDFLREIIADSYGEIEQKRFTLQFQVPDQDVYALFDPELLSRVVYNLITNALTYNPPGTNLRIELIPQATRMVIEIADNGVGIPQELRSTLFDPFVRGDEARTASGGTGLGLAIALKNTERMGGTLELANPGKESTVFKISLQK